MFRLGRIQALMLIVAAAGTFWSVNAFGAPYVDYHFQVSWKSPPDGLYATDFNIGTAYIRLDSWAVNRGYASIGDGVQDIVFDLVGDPYGTLGMDHRLSPANFARENVTMTVVGNTLSFGWFEYLNVYLNDMSYYDPDTDTFYPYGWPEDLDMSDNWMMYCWDKLYTFEARGSWVADDSSAAVPEPSTLLLTGGGVLGLLMCGSRLGGRKPTGGGT